MSSASKAFAVGVAAAVLLARPHALAAPPIAAAAALRVCADPNNLPFSNRNSQGFENKIAELVARDLRRPLAYLWSPQRRGFIRTTLDAGRCDLVIGVPARYERLQSTRAYYRSSYAFVSRRDRHLRVRSFDDARLRTLTIGIQLTGNDYNNPPAAQALASRRIIENVRGYTVYGDYSRPDPQRELVDAVADKRVDVAVIWGPIAGYFAQREPTAIDVVPIAADRDGPALVFAFDIAMGVRRQDQALRAALDTIIVKRRADIRRILTSYGVPLR
jgi:mxaJ protein